MPCWQDLYELLMDGELSPHEIMARLNVRPSRLRRMLASKRLAARLAMAEAISAKSGGHAVVARAGEAARSRRGAHAPVGGPRSPAEPQPRPMPTAPGRPAGGSPVVAEAEGQPYVPSWPRPDGGSSSARRSYETAGKSWPAGPSCPDRPSGDRSCSRAQLCKCPNVRPRDGNVL